MSVLQPEATVMSRVMLPPLGTTPGSLVFLEQESVLTSVALDANRRCLDDPVLPSEPIASAAPKDYVMTVVCSVTKAHAEV